MKAKVNKTTVNKPEEVLAQILDAARLNKREGQIRQYYYHGLGPSTGIAAGPKIKKSGITVTPEYKKVVPKLKNVNTNQHCVN
jgi:hypothetical protein